MWGVRVAELKARDDGPPRGGEFGNVVRSVLAHEPAVVVSLAWPEVCSKNAKERS